MLMDTIRMMVANSKTMEDLQQCEEILKEKKRWVRRQHFSVLSECRLNEIIPKEGFTVESARIAVAQFHAQDEKFKSDVEKSLDLKDDLDGLMEEVVSLLEDVHGKMRDLIWNR